MAYRANPFMERMSERTTSDQTFVRMFSPKILERLEQDALAGGVHVFRSPPGGGKTTLLRALTPTALHAFWNVGQTARSDEAYRGLVNRHVIDQSTGPTTLGVLLSCASGFADLPPGGNNANEGVFRALLDCRIVLRTLRSLASFVGHSTNIRMSDVRLVYDDVARDLVLIPRQTSVPELEKWAEQRERTLYAQLDVVLNGTRDEMPAHVRFEGVLWLQTVHFVAGTQEIAPRHLLMIDDVHKLRKRQRALLIEEMTDLRPGIPVWLAERTSAIEDRLLVPGAREGRELHEYALEQIWGEGGVRQQFVTFAQNILDRRLGVQDQLPPATFTQYLRPQLNQEDIKKPVAKAKELFAREIAERSARTRYSEWITRATDLLTRLDIATLQELFVMRTLLARDERKRQPTLDLEPLAATEIEDRDSSSLQAAAEIFMSEELGVPFYYGMEKLCSLATYNVEELLSMAAALYEALLGKQMLRGQPIILSPAEQDHLLRDVAKRRREFIPKNHSEGARVQQLLDGIAGFCRERTFLPNAPYAPGVTGVRLSAKELSQLTAQDGSARPQHVKTLHRVLSECVADNLLFTRESSASTSREGGKVFYLNRMLCANYGLPLQLGGWQDVTVSKLFEWLERGAPARRQGKLEIG